MRPLLSIASLLIVLAAIGLAVRSQLQANRRLVAGASASAASGASGGAAQPSVAQFQRELDQALKADARHTADQAASAGEDAR